MSDEKHHDTPDDVLKMRALLRAREAPAGEAELTPETLQAFYDGELEPDAAQEVALALVADPSLAQDLRVTAAIGRAREEEASSADATRGSSSTLVWTAVAALAAAMLAFWLLQPPSPQQGGSAEVRAGSEADPIVSAVATEGLAREAFVLTWSGGPEAATYDVSVTTAELDVVFEAFDLPEASARVPPEALAELEAGAQLRWRVTALDEEGRRLDSAAFTVRLR